MIIPMPEILSSNHTEMAKLCIELDESLKVKLYPVRSPSNYPSASTVHNDQDFNQDSKNDLALTPSTIVSWIRMT
jgi:hypothetical protein